MSGSTQALRGRPVHKDLQVSIKRNSENNASPVARELNIYRKHDYHPLLTALVYRSGTFVAWAGSRSIFADAEVTHLTLDEVAKFMGWAQPPAGAESAQ